ncbi:hypothetical protein JYU34_013981 [Plutella xylostella]|uniref:Uncharacterized protein n=1 Tax=Plutella xylostella TaxID=51655 RepID=A0ABQ7Q7C0_PLUXY|nr:hypothetical protein JYU34_013981 [Plutella xylostella]
MRYACHRRPAPADVISIALCMRARKAARSSTCRLHLSQYYINRSELCIER